MEKKIENRLKQIKKNWKRIETIENRLKRLKTDWKQIEADWN